MYPVYSFVLLTNHIFLNRFTALEPVEVKKEPEPPVEVKTEEKAKKEDEEKSPAKPAAAAAAASEQNEQKEITPKTEKEQDEKVFPLRSINLDNASQ